MRVALAQINTTVGDLGGNRDRIVRRIDEARAAGAELVVFPELAVTGYPPEDLLLRPAFVRAAARATGQIAEAATGITALVGAPLAEDGRLYNACFVCENGEIAAVYRKRLLPNYGVFDEERYFESGTEVALLEHGDRTIGLTVCEDLWQPGPPAVESAAAGADLLVNLSASPFHVGKDAEREEMFGARARDNGCALVFCNAVGGQDELVFDGNSFVLDRQGGVVARAPGFEEALLVVDLAETPAGPLATPLGELDQMQLALELGLRDYVEKNGFGDVVIGISGGIDSALTAALAAEALGPESRPLRVDAVPLHLEGDEKRRAARQRVTRRRLPRDPHRGRHRGPRGRRSPGASPVASATPPKRTSRRECGARCSWRSRTSSAGSCSPRETSRSSRSGTRRSTGTWPAASRC